MFLEGSRLYKCCGRPEVRALTDAEEEGKVDPAANGCTDLCQKCQVLQLFSVFIHNFFQFFSINIPQSTVPNLHCLDGVGGAGVGRGPWVRDDPAP